MRSFLAVAVPAQGVFLTAQTSTQKAKEFGRKLAAAKAENGVLPTAQEMNDFKSDCATAAGLTEAPVDAHAAKQLCESLWEGCATATCTPGQECQPLVDRFISKKELLNCPVIQKAVHYNMFCPEEIPDEVSADVFHGGCMSAMHPDPSTGPNGHQPPQVGAAHDSCSAAWNACHVFEKEMPGTGPDETVSKKTATTKCTAIMGAVKAAYLDPTEIPPILHKGDYLAGCLQFMEARTAAEAQENDDVPDDASETAGTNSPEGLCWAMWDKCTYDIGESQAVVLPANATEAAETHKHGNMPPMGSHSSVTSTPRAGAGSNAPPAASMHPATSEPPAVAGSDAPPAASMQPATSEPPAVAGSDAQPAPSMPPAGAGSDAQPATSMPGSFLQFLRQPFSSDAPPAAVFPAAATPAAAIPDNPQGVHGVAKDKIFSGPDSCAPVREYLSNFAQSSIGGDDWVYGKCIPHLGAQHPPQEPHDAVVTDACGTCHNACYDKGQPLHVEADATKECQDCHTCHEGGFMNLGGCDTMLGTHDVDCHHRCDVNLKFGCGKCHDMHESVGKRTNLEQCTRSCEDKVCSVQDMGFHTMPTPSGQDVCGLCHNHCGNDGKCHQKCEDICGVVHRQQTAADVSKAPLEMHDPAVPPVTSDFGASTSDMPPAGSGHVPPPAGSEHVPPPSGSDHVPPPAGSEHVPPPAGSEHVPAPAGSEHVPPPSGSDHVPPPAGSEHVPPPAESEHVPPPAGSDVAPVGFLAVTSDVPHTSDDAHTSDASHTSDAPHTSDDSAHTSDHVHTSDAPHTS